MIRRCARLLALLFCLPLVPVQAEEPLRPVAGGLRLSFEDLRLPGGEWLGLVGLTRFLSRENGVYVGLGTYGAVTGRRGGFFTGGFEGGWQYRWRSLEAGAGLFVGGGGGGSAPQGGGLMIRPQMGMTWATAGGRLGVQASWVQFPNGGIDSRQLALAWSRDWPLWVQPGWGEGPKWRGRSHAQWFGVQSTHYFPRPDSGLGGDLPGRMDLVGVRWRPHWRGRWYGDFETAGAWGGGVDGFAQVLAGIQGWWPVSPRWQLGAGVMLGAAGGGRVHTGGGVVARGWGGVMWHYPDEWGWSLEGGYTTARDGRFAGASLALGLSHRWRALRPEVNGRAQARWHRWRVRPAWQRYLDMGAGDRKFSRLDGVPVDLVGLKIDRFLGGGAYLSGQAWGAFDGGAGGYAVGFLGLGWSHLSGRWHPWGEVNLGAAGGGGIAVGPGILAQPMLGVARVLAGDGVLSLAAGRAWALQGTFAAWVLELSAEYRFTTPGAS